MRKMSRMLQVKNLSRSFGDVSVLKDISLQLEGGAVYGLVGLNGAGKTTFIRVLLGLLRKGGGSVEVAGFDPWRHQPEFYRLVGVALESDGFFGNLTVRENLRIFAQARGIPPEGADRYFEEHWGGTDIFRLAKKIKFLSRGQRVQCGLCRAFLGWPRALFFDEPTVSLDFLAYEHFKKMVREAKSRGAALLISSHQLEVIDDLCDRVGLLRNGYLEEICKGSGQDFSDVVKDIYAKGIVQ
jgi:ABC-type multidrug transport system ATPase subunit